MNEIATNDFEYINHYNFVSSQNEETKINFFESLPKTLQAQVSANPEVNQAVFNGDWKHYNGLFSIKDKNFKKIEKKYWQIKNI